MPVPLLVPETVPVMISLKVKERITLPSAMCVTVSDVIVRVKVPVAGTVVEEA